MSVRSQGKARARHRLDVARIRVVGSAYALEPDHPANDVADVGLVPGRTRHVSFVAQARGRLARLLYVGSSARLHCDPAGVFDDGSVELRLHADFFGLDEAGLRSARRRGGARGREQAIVPYGGAAAWK